jgi:hypothetical protein
MTRAAALAALLLVPGLASAQADTTRRPPRTDTTTSVQGSIYTRPFIASVGRTAVGGYVEGNSNYFVEDGIGDGFSMELRRFNLFLFSPVASRLRFFMELEFEHGTEEIALETAQLDWQLTPAFALRAGILLPPIGAFNQNHDSPRWEFIDRPLVSTRLIPSTLSEVGFGAYGRLRPAPRLGITWDAYLTNGLGEGVISNDEGRTLLAGGKSPEQFAEDNNGSPAVSGRLAMQHSTLGEVGLSYYGGAWNSFRSEGVDVEPRRHVSLAAVDFSTWVGRASVRGEVAHAWIDLPPSHGEVFGARQRGGHVDVVVPLLNRRMFGLPNATLSAALRLEHVDYNVGTFTSTGRKIGDEVTAIVPGISFRPAPGTVFKANYRWHRTRDVLNNPPSRLAGYQVGFATYF